MVDHVKQGLKTAIMEKNPLLGARSVFSNPDPFVLELFRKLFHNPFSECVSNHKHVVFHCLPCLGFRGIILFSESINLCHMVATVSKEQRNERLFGPVRVG